MNNHKASTYPDDSQRRTVGRMESVIITEMALLRPLPWLVLGATLSASVLFAAPADPLRDRLLSSDPAVSGAAVKELSAMSFYQKKVMAENLQSALDLSSPSIKQAADVLSGLGPAAVTATPGLVNALRCDDETTAKSVEDALVGIGSDVITPVRSVLGDPNFFVRRRAAAVLGRLGPQAKAAAPALVNMLNDSEYDVSSAAEAALVRIGEPAIPAVLAKFHESDEQGRVSLLTLLPKLGPSCSPVLVHSLGADESSAVRVAAAQALAALQPVPPDAVAGLMVALNDLDDRVRVAAAQGLSDLGENAKAAIGALIQTAKADGEPIVRQGAQDALQSIGPARNESLPGLSRALRNPNPDVHEAVVSALLTAQVNFSDALPLLTTALHDPTPAVRVKAIQAASKLSGHTSAASALYRSALTDADSSVREAATKALSDTHNGAPDTTAVLQNALKGDDPTTRQAAVHQLGQEGVSAIPLIVPMLKDPNRAVADEASRSIVAMGPGAISTLESFSESSDTVIQTRTAELIAMIKSQAPVKVGGNQHH